MDIFGIGLPELLLIVFVLLLFFGKDKLPELTHSIGKSVRNLKDGFQEGVKGDAPAEGKDGKKK